MTVDCGSLRIAEHLKSTVYEKTLGIFHSPS